jgi:uridine phosphorylase
LKKLPENTRWRRIDQGCVTVEMEAVALIAVAQHRQVSFGQLLYAGVNFSGQWDNRSWQSQAEVRENMFWLATQACLRL